MKRRIVIYSLGCILLWLAAWFIPIRWSSSFMPSDTHHIYNHSFYALLLVAGLLVRPFEKPRLGIATIVGATIGLGSGLISILLVTVMAPTGDLLFSGSAQDLLTQVGISLLMATWFGGPVFGAVLVLLSRIGGSQSAEVDLSATRS